MAAPSMVDAVRACYALDATEAEWLDGVSRAAMPFVDGGLGTGAWAYRMYNPDGAWNHPDRSRAKPGAFPLGIPTEVAEALWRSAEVFSKPERVTLVSRSRVTSAIERLGLTTGLDAHPVVGDIFRPLGIKDIQAITVLDTQGFGVGIASPQAEIVRSQAGMQERLERLASHLLAGFRLRNALAVVDAVFTPDGQTVHAEGEARGASERASLRDAVKAYDQAHAARGREDPDGAVEAWAALVAGRWSIVEQFESDGRRYLVARRNPPGAPLGIPLSALEAHSLLLRAQGLAYKAIRYELGLAEPTIHAHVKSGMQKLGLTNELELARFFGAAAQALSTVPS